MLKLISLSSNRKNFFSSSSVFSKKYKKNNKVLINQLEKGHTKLKANDLLAIMPKEEAHLGNIRKMRMEKRTKRFLVQPSTV